MQAKPSDYESACNEPGTRDYADLCQQWRMAQMATQQVEFINRQLWLSGIEIALLILTLGFSLRVAFKTDRTSRAELRAYVGVVAGMVSWDGKNNPTVHVMIKNSGHTPAYRMTHWIDIGEGENVQFVKTDPETEDSRHDFGPGSEHHLFAALELSEGRAIQVRKREIPLYAWGEIHYSDVFKKTHITKFRLNLYRGPGRDLSNNNLSRCADGNESD